MGLSDFLLSGGNVFWSVSCSTFSQTVVSSSAFIFGAASEMNFSSDSFFSLSSGNDIMNDCDHNDEFLDNVILEPMPLAALPPEPVISNEEFEKEIDLMMLDSDLMAADTSPAHDLEK